MTGRGGGGGGEKNREYEHSLVDLCSHHPHHPRRPALLSLQLLARECGAGSTCSAVFAAVGQRVQGRINMLCCLCSCWPESAGPDQHALLSLQLLARECRAGSTCSAVSAAVGQRVQLLARECRAVGRERRDAL